MYKSGNKRIEACSVPFCASVFLAVVLNLLLWSPHMIRTGSQLEEFGWHSRGTCLMPRVQKSLPHRTLRCKKILFFFGFLNPFTVQEKKLKPPPLHIQSFRTPGFYLTCWISVLCICKLHNKVSSRGLLTDVVDLMFFLIILMSCYSSNLNQAVSSPVSSARYRDIPPVL